MVTPELGQNYMQAAHELVGALEHLGFDMEAAFWVYDCEDERHVLAVVTDVFDAQGPLEISRQLFRAYNASLTPKEISPFIVSLHSTNQIIARSLLHIINDEWKVHRYRKGSPFALAGNDADSIAKGETITVKSAESNGMIVKPEWVIMSKEIHKTRKTVEINRRWHSFKRHVDERIAA